MRSIHPSLSSPVPVPTANAQTAPILKTVEFCSFCEELRDPSTVTLPLVKTFFSDFGQTSRMLLKTDQFFVVPSIGALIPGHVLLLPRTHHYSVGEIPETELRDFESLAVKSREIVSTIYGACTSFEHGCIEGVGRAGACIDHAHLHLLPLEQNLRPEIDKRFGPGIPVGQFADLRQFLFRRTPYLYYQDSSGSARAYQASIAPTQFFRQLVSTAVADSSPWDWKADLRVPVVRQTYERLRIAFRDLEKQLTASRSE
jgi:ATP adenylyltransferase